MSSDEEKVKYLAGALIVFSLLLLYCWYNKKESFSSWRRHRYGRINKLEGMNHNLRTRVPGIKWEAMKSHAHRHHNLNDLENYVGNRNPPSVQQMRQDSTGIRWKVDTKGTGSMEGMHGGSAHVGYKMASNLANPGVPKNTSAMQMEAMDNDLAGDYRVDKNLSDYTADVSQLGLAVNAGYGEPMYAGRSVFAM